MNENECWWYPSTIAQGLSFAQIWELWKFLMSKNIRFICKLDFFSEKCGSFLKKSYKNSKLENLDATKLALFVCDKDKVHIFHTNLQLTFNSFSIFLVLVPEDSSSVLKISSSRCVILSVIGCQLYFLRSYLFPLT